MRTASHREPPHSMDLGKITNPITLIAATVAAAFSTYMSVQYGPTLKKLEIQQGEINTLVSQQNLEQGEKKFDREFKFSIIDRVFTAIGSGKQEQITVALAMVNTMLGDDPATQKELLKAIGNTSEASPADQVQAFANVQKIVRFDSTQVNTLAFVKEAPDPVNTEDVKWRFDVFYGEGRQKLTQPVAEKLAGILEKWSPGAVARLRPLPEVVNARPGYGLKRNEIRYDAGEVEKARQLQAVLEKEGIRMQLHESFSRTGGYISLFVVE